MRVFVSGRLCRPLPLRSGHHSCCKKGEPYETAPHSRIILAVLTLALATMAVHAGDPLPSWNDGAAKKNIMEFINRVTTEGSADFVPVPERMKFTIKSHSCTSRN